MSAGSRLRFPLVVMLVMAAGTLWAQGTENAIAAAVMFGALLFALVLAGVIITVVYVFKRRKWQRVVVLTFGAALLLTGLVIGAQPGRNNDIEFLQLLVSGAGLVCLLMGTLLRSRSADHRKSDEPLA